MLDISESITVLELWHCVTAG